MKHRTQTVENYSSVRDNGKLRPNDHRHVGPDVLDFQAYDDFWGKELSRRWSYKGQTYETGFEAMGFQYAKLLPDETGFMVMQNAYWSAEAKILNGDLSVRCVLKPAFNVRGFDAARLALIAEVRAKELALSPNPNVAGNIVPHFKQQTGRCKKRADGLLEVEGNDGLADCMFHFHSQTGALLSSEPYSWVD